MTRWHLTLKDFDCSGKYFNLYFCCYQTFFYLFIPVYIICAHFSDWDVRFLAFIFLKTFHLEIIPQLQKICKSRSSTKNTCIHFTQILILLFCPFLFIRNSFHIFFFLNIWELIHYGSPSTSIFPNKNVLVCYQSTIINFSKSACIFYLLYHQHSNFVNWPNNVFYNIIFPPNQDPVWISY